MKYAGHATLLDTLVHTQELRAVCRAASSRDAHRHSPRRPLSDRPTRHPRRSEHLLLLLLPRTPVRVEGALHSHRGRVAIHAVRHARHFEDAPATLACGAGVKGVLDG